jgi:23S rRNA (adenine2503-C2)-methyltransferase
MHVNLLRYNPTGLSLRGLTYGPSSMEKTEAFLAELRARGTVAHLRRARGPDIDAACGQLRRRIAKGEGTGDQETVLFPRPPSVL